MSYQVFYVECSDKQYWRRDAPGPQSEFTLLVLMTVWPGWRP